MAAPVSLTRTFANERAAVWAATRAAVEKRFKVRESDSVNGILSFTSGVNAWTWGDRFSLQVVTVGTATEVRVVGSTTANPNQKKVQRLIDEMFTDIGRSLAAATPVRGSVQSAQSPANPEVPTSLAEELAKIAQLHTEGMLTADEFAAAKALLLGQRQAE